MQKASFDCLHLSDQIQLKYTSDELAFTILIYYNSKSAKKCFSSFVIFYRNGSHFLTLRSWRPTKQNKAQLSDP